MKTDELKNFYVTSTTMKHEDIYEIIEDKFIEIFDKHFPASEGWIMRFVKDKKMENSFRGICIWKNKTIVHCSTHCFRVIETGTTAIDLKKFVIYIFDLTSRINPNNSIREVIEIDDSAILDFLNRLVTEWAVEDPYNCAAIRSNKWEFFCHERCRKGYKGSPAKAKNLFKTAGEVLALPCSLGATVERKKDNYRGKVTEFAYNSEGLFLYVDDGFGHLSLVRADEVTVVE